MNVLLTRLARRLSIECVRALNWYIWFCFAENSINNAHESQSLNIHRTKEKQKQKMALKTRIMTLDLWPVSTSF